MTSVSGVSNVSQTSTSSSLQSTSDSMSQMDADAFLQMLMVQLNYQDPTAPMDSQQIVSQLADLTSVTTMGDLKNSVTDLSSQLYSSQSLYASTLVGQEISVIANVMDIEAGETINGEILLSTPADDLKMEIYDESDNLVATLDLGAQTKSGTVAFDTADLTESLPAGKYTLKAIANVGGTEVEPAITQRSDVTSVVVPGAGQEVLIEVDKVGLVPLSYITKLQGENDSALSADASARSSAGTQSLGGAGNAQGAQASSELNNFFNKELLRRYPELRDSGMVSAASTPSTTDTAAMPIGQAALAMARKV